jgi:hypothetical protein
MPSGWARPAVLTILSASLLLLANAVPASGEDPKPPPCKTAAQFDPANFPNPPKIDNQWNPLAPGMQIVLAGEAHGGSGLVPHRVVSTVTDLTKVVNGVTAVVVLETDTNQGAPVKSKLAFQAQDNAGNLWSLGEFPAEFDDKGNFERAPNTWISGLSDAEPGNLMPGNPQLGMPEYLLGWSPDIDFLGCAKVYKMQQKTCVPVGCYDSVLITEEWSPLQPESGRHRKYYAPGVGNVRVGAVGDPEAEELVLVKVNSLSPADLAKARAEALKLEQHAYQVSPKLYGHTPPAAATESGSPGGNNTDNTDLSNEGLSWVPFGPDDPTYPDPGPWPVYNAFAKDRDCEALQSTAEEAFNDLGIAMVALCFAAVEGRDGQWEVVKDKVDGQGSGDECLDKEVRGLLGRAIAWHERHPDDKPDLQFPRARADVPTGKRITSCGKQELESRGELGPTETESTETGPTETGPTETGPTETGPTETGPTETEPPATEPTDTTQ